MHNFTAVSSMHHLFFFFLGEVVVSNGWLPTPIIEWSKGEEMVDYQMTRYRTNKKSLKIRNVNIEDSGRYLKLICNAPYLIFCTDLSARASTGLESRRSRSTC